MADTNVGVSTRNKRNILEAEHKQSSFKLSNTMQVENNNEVQFSKNDKELEKPIFINDKIESFISNKNAFEK